VRVYYTGRLANGKVFDSTTMGNGFKFKLGKKEVISGWDVGLNGMLCVSIAVLQLCQCVRKISNFQPISLRISEMLRGYYDRLIASRIRTFDWYQNYQSWMISNDRYTLYCRKYANFVDHHKNLNEDRPILFSGINVGQRL